MPHLCGFRFRDDHVSCFALLWEQEQLMIVQKISGFLDLHTEAMTTWLLAHLVHRCLALWQMERFCLLSKSFQPFRKLL